ncbi:hypothetical protein J2045_001988 [Peteryoungia aggregata LMG 23059]|uniref:Uncharacterized protein n=1 Tax=Peteryoungia aggregata LMG 23059 TaxID=1368425 RepID=A0ABU0G6I8_9HYPH|nr:hypothetical protein [Peteryoungia aggregata]MDQ0420961.1 hypothetical protein [Peteryoungia aggregata LMG 23059]
MTAYRENVISLAADMNLRPEARVIDLVGETTTVLNADAVIALAKSTDTPEARRIYRAYRKRKVELKRGNSSMNDAELRAAAIMSVLPVQLV